MVTMSLIQVTARLGCSSALALRLLTVQARPL